MKKTTTNNCRLCGGNHINSIIDFGNMAISNNLISENLKKEEEKYQLELCICDNCKLVQVVNPIDKSIIFHEEYTYFSSVSSSWLTHVSECVTSSLKVRKSFGLETNFAIDIASNDGYLLNNFKSLGIKNLGIEPSRSVAQHAIENGIDTIIDFFSEKLARQLIYENKIPDLVFALNVVGHVPNPKDFFSGLSILADNGAFIVIEIPYFKTLISKIQFDTIYHEHYQYYFLETFNYLIKVYGFNIIDFSTTDTHGGSIHIILSKKSKSLDYARKFKKDLMSEEKIFANSLKVFKKFNESVRKKVVELDNILLEANYNSIICGYGAAAKTSTFLGLCENSNNLSAVFDKSPSKIGKLIPGTNVKILDPIQIIEINPDILIVFTWNIANEIYNDLRSIYANAKKELPKIITLIPKYKEWN